MKSDLLRAADCAEECDHLLNVADRAVSEGDLTLAHYYRLDALAWRRRELSALRGGA